MIVAVISYDDTRDMATERNAYLESGFCAYNCK